MPWIQSAFVECLEPEQVLQLWDRLLAYGSLTLLPVLAAAIFSFREEAVMQAADAAAVQALFADNSQLKVLPLLQYFIFPGW